MAFRKTKDLAVATGKYMKDGQEKNRYANVGYILQDDNGATMICLNRHFNPAGVPFKEGSESIILSQFEVKEHGAAVSAAPSFTPAINAADPNQDVPF
jgi:hypothetical protein